MVVASLHNKNKKEGIKMNKNNYEKYADVEQPKALKETRTLEESIKMLQQCKNSGWNIDNAIDFIGILFDRSYEEIVRLIDNKEYWIV
jgi:hypothetical protein